jgi:hypothetical protein
VSPFIDATSAAPSRRPYGLVRQTFKRRDNLGMTVIAYWLGRRNGRTTVSFGSVHMWWQGMPESPTWEECLANIDGRYGGNCRARWDGESLWVAEEVPPQQYAEFVPMLDSVLRNLPDVPPGVDRWRWLR